MIIGESRSELLSWLNSAFGLEYKKVEQCGTGAAYCQIMDSVYGGVPMAKVKFGALISDYDARNNMKILQALFNRHKITRQIDTERLIRCRLQDNLELLQWLKRHWMENKDANIAYDAPARRRGGTASGQGERAGSGTSRRTTLTPSSANSASQSSTLPHSGGVDSRVSSAEMARDLQEKTQQWKLVQEELVEYRVMTESLEAERNFYFNKLRDIEELLKLIQEQYARDDVTAENVRLLSVLDVMAEIQEILYSTEKGFEIQDTADAESF
ncbi:hypothetical protein METBIDRAFT_38967 [Metschnikowia bicuspidata var. bicuspidata NRRL YB-4993]|uniref:Microtubule binding protein n=1 Tax=Metschnikowia bicuspidata var. bicuspidata NRRL YB-4993 TaxID=869754 RepID=A0A1A0HDH0_9ASCO|nr:hypothetical protein METBIDRAFT_38967 [Metschnikowia bicuspidata var. bicuspidata NRRL YB-4993]OBA21942.1 hypothetical protein METBIDRAFT_38967 [Metschnikowia bicuspidata var. bicuspidata NRRL YB-4993]